MPRYVVSISPEADINNVAESMRRAGANIIGINSTPKSKRTSGRFSLECSEELIAQLEKIEGVKYIEEEIPHHSVSR